LHVDNEAGYEVSEHVTNLENPTIAVGATFEDGDTFKRAIRQFVVLNEFEITTPYSEAKRYTEATAKEPRARRRDANGGSMLLNCRMGRLGRSNPFFFCSFKICPVFLICV
jgi:hypothetical protein